MRLLLHSTCCRQALLETKSFTPQDDADAADSEKVDVDNPALLSISTNGQQLHLTWHEVAEISRTCYSFVW